MSNSALKGQIAVITGASRGIGRALALGFAKEGATVVVAARTEQPGPVPGTIHETVQAIRSQGGQAMAVRCDVRMPDDMNRLVDTTLKEFGRIDIGVHDAAVLQRGGPIALDPADWDNIMAVGPKGAFLFFKYVLPPMIKRRQGNVVIITGPAAVEYERDHIAYPAAKAALERLTLNVAGDMETHNIAINAFRPGLVETNMTKTIPDHARAGRIPDQPEEVVPAALWLVQQDASTITGRVLSRIEFGKTWP